MSVPDAVPETGAGARFQPTRWTIVLQAADSASPEAHEALSKLCETYWSPLYAFIRFEGNDRDKAKDLTQAFFEHLLESKLVKRADREKGKFRTFLLTSLKNFLIDEHRREKAKFRGGAFKFISINEQEGEEIYNSLPAHEPDSTALFDRAWAANIVRKVKAKLKQVYVEKGQVDLHEALRPHLAGGGERGFCAEVAKTFKEDENAMHVALHRMRRTFARLLRQEVAQTVGTSADIDEELNHLMKVWAADQGKMTTTVPPPERK